MDAALEFNPASTNINEVFIEAAPGKHTGTFESIVLVGDEPASASVAPDPVISPQALSAPIPLQAEDNAAVDVRRMRDALAEPIRGRPVVELSVESAAAPASEAAAADAAPTAAPDQQTSLVDWSAPRKPPVQSRSRLKRRC